MARPFNPTWTVHTHVIPSSHPRGYRRGVRDPQTSRLRLHVKQYIPRHEQPLPPNALTILIQHGLPPGDNKEAFEPFMWDLLCQPGIPPIRGFWAMDIAISGESFLLNHGEIGDEPNWFDPARDLFQLVNYFQAEMRPPMVAYCHSYGANAAVACSAWSPRMFQGIALCEPVFETGWFHQNNPKRLNGELPAITPGMLLSGALAKRRTRWANREEAKKYYEKSKLHAKYDQRSLQLLLEHDLKDLPDGSVELKTPSLQVVQIVARPSPPLDGYPEGEDYATRCLPESEFPQGFYNANGARVKEYLQSVHCPVLFQWSTDVGFVSEEPYRDRVVNATGTGLGGGGGKAKGQITEVFLEGPHSVVLQNPTVAAKSFAIWLRERLWPQWMAEEEERKREAPIDPTAFPPALMERIEKAMPKSLPKL